MSSGSTDELAAWLDYQDSLRRFYIENGQTPEEASERAIAEVRAEIRQRSKANGKSRTDPYHSVARTLFGHWRVDDAAGRWRATFRDRADALTFIEHAPELQQ